MGAYSGPNGIEDGLVFFLDAANPKGISPLGNNSFNGATQVIKNLISLDDNVQSINGVNIGNLSYYTVFAIDYPEGSYGGDAASRDGITPGLNVRSGTKTFEFGRALHYAVYNNPTQSWVKTTVYDSYVGTAAVNTFVSEYATAVATYPDAIHVVAGSHRDSYHTTAQYNILKDLGAPSNVDSIINFSSPEWILVGKPGLGAGNAYGWVFQNYTTNSTRVAHLNFGLPIYGGTDNYLSFDGVNDYVTTGLTRGTLGNQTTLIAWYKYTGTAGRTYSPIFGGVEPSVGTEFFIGKNAGNTNIGIQDGNYNSSFVTGSNAFDGNYHQIVYSYDSTTGKIYLDGTLKNTGSFTKCNDAEGILIGHEAEGSGYYFIGNISQVSIYNRALTAAEISQNYNATKSRYT